MSTVVSQAWRYPGKVLIIDDEYYEDKEKTRGVIFDAVNELINDGVPVEYWDGRTKRGFVNVRVVVLDLLLDKKKEDWDEEQVDFYFDAADALSVVPGRPVVVILSTLYDEKKRELLKQAFARRIERPFLGVFAKEGLNKGELDKGMLLQKIELAIKEDPITELALLWESVLDSATDKTYSEIFTVDKAATIERLLQIIHTESGKSGQSLGRGFMEMVLRILTRYTKEGDPVDALNGKLIDIVQNLEEREKAARQGNAEAGTAQAAPVAIAPIRSFPLSMIMYYDPRKEPLWTGEIYNPNESSARQYAILMNPMCDFAQGRVEMVTICYGFRIGVKELGSLDHPLYKKDKELRELSDEASSSQGQDKEGKERKAVKRAKGIYMSESGSAIPDRFHRLPHFFPTTEDDNNRTMLCFDFQDVESTTDFSREEGIVKKWQRVKRVDTPYIDLMLRDFGLYMSRLGAMGINSPFRQAT